MHFDLQMPKRRLYVGRRHPHPPYIGPARCTGAAPGDTQSPGCLRTAVRMWRICTSAFSHACRGTIRRGHASFSCVLGTSDPAPWRRPSCLRRPQTIWAARVRPPRYVCICTPFRWRGTRTCAWGSPANETRYHAPSVLWAATSQRLPVKVLIRSLPLADMESAARYTLLQGPAFPGFLALPTSHA